MLKKKTFGPRVQRCVCKLFMTATRSTGRVPLDGVSVVRQFWLLQQGEERVNVLKASGDLIIFFF